MKSNRFSLVPRIFRCFFDFLLFFFKFHLELSASYGRYSTETDCLGYGVYSKPQSYFATQIEFLKIITELKEKL